MRRPLLLAALAATFLATPALADVTVRYRAVLPDSAPENVRQNPPTLVLTADGAGQARWRMAAPDMPTREGVQPASITFITREGVGYGVVNGPQPGMRFVARLDDAFAVVMELAGPLMQGSLREGAQQIMSQRVEITPVGPETVNGVRGNLYRIVTVDGETRGPPVEMVVATDPRLAPIGQEFLRMTESVRPAVVTLLGGEPQLYAALRGMFALGAPLRIGTQIQLEHVNTDDVPDSEFALPSPPMTRAQLQAMATMMMGMMQQGQSGRPPGAPAPAPATPSGNAANPH